MTHVFDKHYFHGGTKVGGYAGSGYRDFPAHWATYAHVMERRPESVLELGCGRGYLLKRFDAYAKIPIMGLEISEHCRLTRAIENVRTHDVTVAPWPIADQAFDLCLSMAFLEHVPEDRLPAIFAEMARTTRRGLHGIDIHDDDHFDQTHCTIRPLAWWQERMPRGHEAVDKEDLERGAKILPQGVEDGVKLNLGSFTHMFHGWRNLDCIDLTPWAHANGYSFAKCDLAAGLPYNDQIVDRIFLSHVLEHFDYATGERLIRECRRVLKPTGKIRIAVPDTALLWDLYRAKQIRTLGELCGSDPKTDIQLLHELLYGGDHLALYDWDNLHQLCVTAGFSQVARSQFGVCPDDIIRRETIDQYPEMSLFVDGSP